MINKRKVVPSDKERAVVVFTELSNAIITLTKNKHVFYIDLVNTKPITKRDKEITAAAKLVHSLITGASLDRYPSDLVHNLIYGSYSASLNSIQLVSGEGMVDYVAYPSGIIWLSEVDNKLLADPAPILIEQLMDSVGNVKQLNRIVGAQCQHILSSRKLR